MHEASLIQHQASEVAVNSIMIPHILEIKLSKLSASIQCPKSKVAAIHLASKTC